MDIKKTTMKTMLVALFAKSLVFLSCEKVEKPPHEDVGGLYGVYPNFGTCIRIVNGRGTDILHPEKKEGYYTYEDIDVMVQRGKKTVPYRSYELESPVFADYPRGFRIHDGVGTLPYYVLETSFPLGNKEKESSKDIQFYSFGLRIGNNGKTYQLRGEAKVFRSENDSPWMLYGGGKAIVTERVWLDGKLAWEAGKDELPAARNPIITIIVPD